MAKLDFFVRYPHFFEKANAIEGKPQTLGEQEVPETVESSMVRFHYGPWDQRYYHVLAFLEARGLLEVTKADNSYNLVLSAAGKDTITQILRNRFYLGELPDGEYSQGHSRRGSYTKGTAGKHQAFVPEDLWNAAQKAREIDTTDGG